MTPLQTILKKTAEAIAPPPDLLCHEWADRYRILSPEASSSPGHFRSSMTPYVVEIMDTVNDDSVHTCAWMASAQVAKSETLNNVVGYFIHQDPAPMLFIQPTVEMAEAYSKDRIKPMIRDTPELNELININGRGNGNTVLHKTFPGGHLTFVGANSPSGLASRPVRNVIGDEIDRYEASAGTEGDPVTLAQKRTTTFYNKMHFYASTPGNAESSRIEPLFLSGDQRRYMVPCPHCGVYQILRWPQIKFDSRDPIKSTYYECEHCEGKITDKHKRALINNGYWKPHAEFKGIATFHIWEAYSPWVKFYEIVEAFLKAKSNPEELKVWVNTSLGETWSESGDAPEWKLLYNRRETWKREVVPAQALKLVSAIDVQRDRLEMEVRGYGRNSESWSVDYFVFPGDTSDITSKKSPWREAEKVMNRTWKHEYGGNIGIEVTAVDSSDQTMAVYSWGRMHGRRVMCIKGRKTASALLGTPKPQDIRKNGKTRRNGILLYIIGTDIGKTALYGRLKIEQPTDTEIKDEGYPAGYYHFNDWQDEEYFKQMCAEQRRRKRNKKGYWENEWHKLRDRNEVLDINVYMMACFDRLALGRMTEKDWTAIEIELGRSVNPDGTPVSDTRKVKHVEKKSTSGRIKRRKTNFMDKG